MPQHLFSIPTKLRTEVSLLTPLSKKDNDDWINKSTTDFDKKKLLLLAGMCGALYADSSSSEEEETGWYYDTWTDRYSCPFCPRSKAKGEADLFSAGDHLRRVHPGAVIITSTYQYKDECGDFRWGIEYKYQK